MELDVLRLGILILMSVSEGVTHMVGRRPSTVNITRFWHSKTMNKIIDLQSFYYLHLENLSD